MVKKEISVKTATKAIITGFVSYGIILGFLYTIILFVFKMFVSRTIFNNIFYAFVLPFMSIFITYFIAHALCRLSTYDVFKKCKINTENIKSVSQKMNLFFILFLIISVLCSIAYLYLDLNSRTKQVEIAKLEYNEVFSQNFTNKLTDEMIEQLNLDRQNLIMSTTIFELGIAISCFALIPFQKKMITKYNEN